MYIEYKGESYELATTLRVAYKVQGYFNHKSYLEIFESIDKMLVEQQIDIIYAALTVGNPTLQVKRNEFLDYCLDHYDVGALMEIIKEVISGIIGEKVMEKVQEENDSNLEESEKVFTHGTISSREEPSAV